MNTLTLISHPLCPYVQRAAIVLAEKSVAFERRYVDLANKPDWFLQISPLGKVPLLIVHREPQEDVVIFESVVICEYLEEAHPQPALHVADPLERALQRAWIEFGSAILTNLWMFQTAQNAGIYEEQRKLLEEKFARVETALSENAGSGNADSQRSSQASSPYFAGENFSMVDAIYAPIFFSFAVFENVAEALFADTPKVNAWRRALMQRASVQSAPPPDYAQRLRAYLVERNAHLLKI